MKMYYLGNFCYRLNHITYSHSLCSSQDSIIKMFLGVECLQPAIIDLLLEKLPEYMSDEYVVLGFIAQVLIIVGILAMEIIFQR